MNWFAQHTYVAVWLILGTVFLIAVLVLGYR